MTANQLAAESNRIDEYNAETQRYNYEREKERDARNYEISLAINVINKDSLEETKRHNAKLEELQGQAQELERRKVDIDEQYKITTTELQRRYNEVSLELQAAQGDRKLDLQEQANAITQEKNRYEYEVSVWKNQLQEESNEINRLYLEQQALHESELARSNAMREKLEASSQQIQLRALESKESIAAKQLSYDQQRDLLDRQLKINDLNARLLNWQNTYYLGIQGLNLDLMNTFQRVREYDTTGKMLQWSQTANNLTGALQHASQGVTGFRLFDLAQ